MTLALFGAFWAVSILFVITPGVDWAYAISAGMRGRVVIPAVTGLLLGHLTAILIVAAGVGALVASNPLALSLLTLLGAAYLLWLGINLLLHPAMPTADKDQSPGAWYISPAAPSSTCWWVTAPRPYSAPAPWRRAE